MGTSSPFPHQAYRPALISLHVVPQKEVLLLPPRLTFHHLDAPRLPLSFNMRFIFSISSFPSAQQKFSNPPPPTAAAVLFTLICWEHNSKMLLLCSFHFSSLHSGFCLHCSGHSCKLPSMRRQDFQPFSTCKGLSFLSETGSQVQRGLNRTVGE